MALLAAEQVTAQLKASQALEQHVVSKFLHNLCEQVCPPSSGCIGSLALPCNPCWAHLEKRRQLYRCPALSTSALSQKGDTAGQMY